MSTQKSDSVVAVNFKKFPYHLLIPDSDNKLILELVSQSTKVETFTLDIKNDKLKVELNEELSEDIKLKPNETREITLNLNPLENGYGTITIIIDWVKEVEYTVKVQKVRETISKSIVNEIFDKHALKPIEPLKAFKSKRFILDISKSELKELKKEIKEMRESYELQQQNFNSEDKKIGDSELEVKTDQMPKVSLDDIEQKLKRLAKGYLSIEEIHKALNTIMQLSSEEERKQLELNLIKAYGIKNFEKFFNFLQDVEDIDFRNKIVESEALILSRTDPDKAIKLVNLLTNKKAKDELSKNIILRSVKERPEKSYNFINLIKDKILKVKLLFTLGEQYYKKAEKPKLFNILREITDIILRQDHEQIKKNSFNNSYYELLKDALSGIAEIETPKLTDTLIKQITDQILIKKLTVDLFDLIYTMEDEMRTKMESKTVFSQVYQFNTFISKINAEIKNFVKKGGNVSGNLLKKDQNCKCAFLSLFSFDFSIFPTYDRLYNDLKNNSTENICHYIFPSNENHNEKEKKIITRTINQFFLTGSRTLGLQTIFNTDFIPYLGKPTVIMKSEHSVEENLQNKINTTFGDRLQFLTEESIFEGGKTVKMLNEIFSANQSLAQINLIFSYEFLNDYNLLYEFVNMLIEII